MAHLYRAEVVFAPVGSTNGNPEVSFVVTDQNEVFAMNVIRDDGAGNTAIQLYFAASPNGIGSLISGTSTLTGVGTTAYDSGGTLAFEKDEAVDEIRWITPLGTQTRSLTTFGALDDQPLEPYSIATSLTRSPTNVNANVAVDWSAFYGMRDGANYLGAAMSETDPGIWEDPQATTSSGGAGGPINLANSQGVTAYRSGLSYIHATDAPRHTATREYRIWAGGHNISANPVDYLIDAIVHPLSGHVHWVRVPAHDKETVLFGRSEDRGVTLTEVTVHTEGGAWFQYPTLAVDPLGRVIVFWGNKNDRGQLWWALSNTYGQAFETAQTGSWPDGVANADSPRYRYHPTSGHGILAFRDQMAPGFKAAVVTEFNAVLGATVLETSAVRRANNPHYGVLITNSTGVMRHLANEGPNRAVAFSTTYGMTWEEFLAEEEVPTVALQPALDYSETVGLTFWAYQEDTGDVKAHPSDTTVRNPPDTTLYGVAPWSIATVVAALPLQQYVGLAAGPNGILYVLYQTESGGIYSVHCKISVDHGASWSVP